MLNAAFPLAPWRVHSKCYLVRQSLAKLNLALERYKASLNYISPTRIWHVDHVRAHPVYKESHMFGS
jgi:hypothetical protein